MTLDFSDLQPVALPVKGPDGKDYVLKEANGAAAKKYNNARIRGAKLGEHGQVEQIGDLGDLEPLLVSLCLFGEHDRPLTQTFIEKWPARVVKALHKKAEEISGLQEGESPILTGLKTVLSRVQSPIQYEDLRDYVLSQNGQDTESIRSLFEQDEDLAKNSSTTTTDGST